MDDELFFTLAQIVLVIVACCAVLLIVLAFMGKLDGTTVTIDGRPCKQISHSATKAEYVCQVGR